MPAHKVPLALRFWAKVEKTPTCWLWIGAKHASGYGSLWREGTYHGAHRVAYELFRGPIPVGLELDHLCRVRSCVNPEHLEIVTRRENMLRGPTLQAANAAKTVCCHGHPFTADNTRVYKGMRVCLSCRRETDQRAKARKRAARMVPP